MQDIGMNTEIRAVIEHRQGTEEFLEHCLCRFSVEMQQINRILQIPICVLDTPAQVVKVFQLLGRKLIARQVGNKAFITVI
jgi:hypothetical protein